MDIEKLFSSTARIPRLSKDETIALYKRHMMAQYERAEAAERELARLQKGLRDYDAWASRMPDAGFDNTWDWWYERPYAQARALLAPDRGEHGNVRDLERMIERWKPAEDGAGATWEDCICIHGNAVTPGCPYCDPRVEDGAE